LEKNLNYTKDIFDLYTFKYSVNVSSVPFISAKKSLDSSGQRFFSICFISSESIFKSSFVSSPKKLSACSLSNSKSLCSLNF